MNGVRDARAMFSPADWKLIPLKLRMQFWKESDYGKYAPSEELFEKIQEAINVRKRRV